MPFIHKLRHHLVNNRIIPLIFLAAIFTVPAIAVQSAYAGICVECGDPFFEQGPDSPEHTTISPIHGSFGFGAPIVYWGEPFMITLDTNLGAWQLCPGDTITSIDVGLGPFQDNIFGGGFELAGIEDFFLQPVFAGAGASQAMAPIGGGLWKANFPALNPLHGNAVITYTWTCELTGADIQGPMEDGGIFMDPSGQVTNACTGDPIENAEVTLNSNHFGPFLLAPFGSFIPPLNPFITDVNGLYAWDVEQGFNYRVDVEATLLTGADQDYVSQMSAILPVPPEQFGIDFALVPVNGCQAIGGEIIPIETTSLLLAGAQTNALWIFPVLLAGAGIALVLVKRK